MKIGIFAGGRDMLTLFRFLNKYNHEYIIYYDSDLGPLGQKSVPFIEQELRKGMEFLLSKAVDYIIVPMAFERFCTHISDKVLPLFHTYLLQYCFAFSKVGKLGFFGGSGEVSFFERDFSYFESLYQKTDTQSRIKKFHFPFAVWYKTISLLQYVIYTNTDKKLLINTLIKDELRYFKDAGVDTLIPLDYATFFYEKSIQHFFNPKKTVLSGIDYFEKNFDMFCPNSEKTTYSILLCSDGGTVDFLNNKRILWSLQRGKKINILYEKKQ